MRPDPNSQCDPSNTPWERDVRFWNMICHLSALAGCLIPIGNVLGPLIVWRIKKNTIPSVETHGKAALNFQITVSIVLLAGFATLQALSVCVRHAEKVDHNVFAGLLVFLSVGVVLPVLVVVSIGSTVCVVIAGIKANGGEEFRYPWSLTFVHPSCELPPVLPQTIAPPITKDVIEEAAVKSQALTPAAPTASLPIHPERIISVFVVAKPEERTPSIDDSEFTMQVHIRLNPDLSLAILDRNLSIRFRYKTAPILPGASNDEAFFEYLMHNIVRKQLGNSAIIQFQNAQYPPGEYGPHNFAVVTVLKTPDGEDPKIIVCEGPIQVA